MTLRLHYPDGPPVDMPLKPHEEQQYARRRPGGRVVIELNGGPQRVASVFDVVLRSRHTIACRWVRDEVVV